MKHLLFGTAKQAWKCVAAAAIIAVFGVSTNSVAHIYVVQVGDGTAALNTASTAAFVHKFVNSGGSPLATINLPTTDEGVGFNRPLTLSGSSNSEGFLALSTDGQYLTLGGYGVAPGQAAVGQTDSTTVNRVVGRIEIGTGTVDTTTALSDAYIGSAGSTANIRSAASTDGTKFWTSGNSFSAGGGTRFSQLAGTTSTMLSSAPTNARVAKIFGGQLYVSSTSSGFVGVNAVGTGLPETSGETTTLLPGFSVGSGTGTASPYDFWLKDSNTLYVTDDRSQASGGGIQKWLLNAGTWELAYTLQTGTTGARGLTGMIDGENTVLFATTTQSSANRLVTITDTGIGSVSSELATAPTNTAFRGVAFVTPPGVLGDYNGNGEVDAADYVMWRENENTANVLPNDPAGGTIGQTQYDNWRMNFGNSNAGSGVAAAAAVPEPAGVVLLLMGLAAMCGRRRAA